MLLVGFAACKIVQGGPAEDQLAASQEREKVDPTGRAKTRGKRRRARYASWQLQVRCMHGRNIALAIAVGRHGSRRVECDPRLRRWVFACSRGRCNKFAD